MWLDRRGNVSEFERLQRDIDILRETLRIDQSDLAAVSLKSADVKTDPRAYLLVH